jgi:hypothetical protein
MKLKAYRQVISQKFFKQVIRYIGIATILLIIVSRVHLTVEAQQPIHWSPYERIPGYADDTLPPYFIADQNRTVHAFTSQWVGDDDRQLAILYRQWTLAKGWTDPVDILLSPIGEARMYGAFLDQTGIMHVIFFGGDDQYANIYYTRALAANAGNAQAWSKPESVGWNAITPSFAAFAGDNKGNLVIVYSGNIDKVGLYAIYSSDAGDTWSEPTPFFFDYSGELVVPAFINIYMGKSGQLYAVWNMVNQKGHNTSSHFARLDVDSRKWSEPIEFTEGIGIEAGMGIMNATVIEYNNKILVRYNNGIPPDGVPPSEWLQESSDGGQTWTAPLRLFPGHVGRNGIASFVIDSNDVLHILFAMRMPTTINGNYTAIGGIWYSVLQGSRWNQPILVAKDGDRGDQGSLAAYDAKAVISQGNVILVTWRGDPGQVPGGNGVWYSFATLDTPELPVVPLPTMPAASSTVPTAMPTATNTAIITTPIPTPYSSSGKINLNNEPPASSSTNNPTAPLIFAIMLVVLLIVVIIVIHRLNYLNG